ncbi:DNRLRE domain-containing protein [Nonomuraea sp. B1E8]|uniref:DNRLRE domain-containing protein n=1 Tax=unclassified Nonomuraea TaxID=2593643 RepID=UPI00325C8798
MSAPAIAQNPTPPPTPASATSPPSTPATPTSKALAQAKKDNRRIEIESMRSEGATFYANPDGKTVRMEMHTQPIRVKHADGKGFTPIDTTLIEADGAIKPKAAHGDLVLSAGQDKTLLKSRAADATAQIGTPSVLPEPRLKGSTATYPDAYGKGRDLVVTANATGFRQRIVIAERPTGPVSFQVPVDLPEGLSFKTNAAGRPIIVGKDGKTLTEVRPTLLQDATAADAGAPIDAGKVGKAAVTLSEDGTSLVFTPDAAFLADPAVTYPVTMAAAADDWWETDTSEWHLGGQDTFVNDADYPDSWDNFTLDRILVGKSNDGAVRWRGYLQFPDVPAEFAGATVENADLILWNYYSNACGERVGSGITARRITSDWEEATLHWNSQPSVTDTGADTEYGAYSDYAALARWPTPGT